jgi:hypothetical protein
MFIGVRGSVARRLERGFSFGIKMILKCVDARECSAQRICLFCKRSDVNAQVVLVACVPFCVDGIAKGVRVRIDFLDLVNKSLYAVERFERRAVVVPLPTLSREYFYATPEATDSVHGA